MCTAQHDDEVIQHIPHACWDRCPIVPQSMINITSHIIQKYTLSTYLVNTPCTYLTFYDTVYKIMTSTQLLKLIDTYLSFCIQYFVYSILKYYFIISVMYFIYYLLVSFKWYGIGILLYVLLWLLRMVISQNMLDLKWINFFQIVFFVIIMEYMECAIKNECLTLCDFFHYVEILLSYYKLWIYENAFLGLCYVKNVTFVLKKLSWLIFPIGNENWTYKIISETGLWDNFSYVHFHKRNLHSEPIIEFI